jgi:hypothetical protein
MAEELKANTIAELPLAVLEERMAWLTKALSGRGYKEGGKCVSRPPLRHSARLLCPFCPYAPSC